MGWRVIGPVAAVIIDGSVRYIERDGTFKAGDNAAHLAAIGLIEPVEDAVIEQPAPEDAGAPAQPVDLAELTVEQLKEFAAEHNIDVGKATKRDDILAAITSAG